MPPLRGELQEATRLVSTRTSSLIYHRHRNGRRKRLREAIHPEQLSSRIPNHAGRARLIRLANDVDASNLSSCDAIISPMHELEASPVPGPALIISVFSTCISASTLPWGGVLLVIFPSSLPALLPLSSHPPTVSRNGALSISRYVPNPSEALPQAVVCCSIRPAWAKGLATRMPSPSSSHPTPPTVRGGCRVRRVS